VTKRLHSGEAATARKDGVTWTVIKSLRGGHGGRQHVFAASSLDGAVLEQYGAMNAGGGALVAPPQKRGSSKTGQPQGRRGRNRSGPFGHDFLFISLFFSYFFPPIKRGFFPKKEEHGWVLLYPGACP
jgi:hypothetical protein